MDLEFSVIEYDQLGAVRERSGNRSQYAGPSNVYQTKDQRWFSMSASAQPVFERLARTIERPDLIDDPDFSTNPARVRNAEALDEIISPWKQLISQGYRSIHIQQETKNLIESHKYLLAV